MKYIDTNRLRAEIEKIYKSEIAQWLSGVSATSAIYDYVLPLIDSLQQEQPEVDLEKEIERVVEKYNSLANGRRVMKPSGIEKIARHFYELGKNSK